MLFHPAAATTSAAATAGLRHGWSYSRDDNRFGRRGPDVIPGNVSGDAILGFNLAETVGAINHRDFLPFAKLKVGAKILRGTVFVKCRLGSDNDEFATGLLGRPSQAGDA